MFLKRESYFLWLRIFEVSLTAHVYPVALHKMTKASEITAIVKADNTMLLESMAIRDINYLASS